MAQILDTAVTVALVLFMVGSLLEMGLGLRLGDALRGLADLGFVARAVVLGFVAGPLLAWGVARVLWLSPGYGVGLMLVGLAPCAPFLPTMVRRAGGDMQTAAAMMLVTAAGTILVLPVAVPFVAQGLSADAWTIARPLVGMVLVPLVVGMAVFRARPGWAAWLHGPVKRVTGIAALALLVLCAVVYGPAMAATFGERAIAAQVLFLALVTAAGYGLGAGLPEARRSVLALGLGTRNLGAALAPLLGAATPDREAVVMVVLGLPVQILLALVAASWFARAARRAQAPTP